MGSLFSQSLEIIRGLYESGNTDSDILAKMGDSGYIAEAGIGQDLIDEIKWHIQHQ